MTYKPVGSNQRAAFNPYKSTFNVTGLFNLNGSNGTRAGAHFQIGQYLQYFSQPRSAGTNAMANVQYVQHQRRTPGYGGPAVIVNPPEKKKADSSEKSAKPKKPEIPVHHKNAAITPGNEKNKPLSDDQVRTRMVKLGMSADTFNKEGLKEGDQWVHGKGFNERWQRNEEDNKWRVTEVQFKDKPKKITTAELEDRMYGTVKGHSWSSGDPDKDPMVMTVDANGNQVSWLRMDNEDGKTSWTRESITSPEAGGTTDVDTDIDTNE